MTLESVPFVGDSLTDMQAAQAAGCLPHLVLTGKSLGLRGQSLPADFPAHTRMYNDLDAFVTHWLRKSVAPAAALPTVAN